MRYPIAALEKNNIGGANNGKIFDLESQIWGDKDAIRDLQEGLWQELEDAFDDIFDKAKEDIDAIGDEIEAIQDQMDGHYVRLTFSAAPAFPAELDRIFRITDGVMRSIIVCLDE